MVFEREDGLDLLELFVHTFLQVVIVAEHVSRQVKEETPNDAAILVWELFVLPQEHT